MFHAFRFSPDIDAALYGIDADINGGAIVLWHHRQLESV